MEALRKDNNGGYHITTKAIMGFIAFLIVFGTCIVTAVDFASTNRATIMKNTEDITEIKGDYISKTEFEYIKDNQKEIKDALKDINKKLDNLKGGE